VQGEKIGNFVARIANDMRANQLIGLVVRLRHCVALAFPFYVMFFDSNFVLIKVGGGELNDMQTSAPGVEMSD
jgi:hypothetical protein